MKNIIILLFSLMAIGYSHAVMAHDPDISSLALVEQPNGGWMIQLNASMTAFQYEVRQAFGEDSYSSPEEFNQLLLDHLKENIRLQINGHKMALKNGMVNLGHATTVAFDLGQLPDGVEEIFIDNKAFENIYHSQVIFSLNKEGIDQSRFILNQANDYQMSLSLKDNQVLEATSSRADPWKLITVSLLALGLVGIFLRKTDFRQRIFPHKTGNQLETHPY
ncbi:hypothetical protein GCM10007049_01090 [Echinicola pacifica]|uniref:Uncharacterized protein n=1 Tax=Echinicola pacifica TaxID=346377 RepID=A0A918UIQ3_9BACT|nr:hypothetical protein [Echinicola pacifica]GGZ13107.1 hypothetical protein GCM10007049_01090 [Echinicola pacifica]